MLQRPKLLVAFLVCTAVFAALAGQPARGAGLTFTVDSAFDGDDAKPGDGICDDGSGMCTLRAAIDEANATAGLDTIAFKLPSGSTTIAVSGALPPITDAVVIDGSTQPTYLHDPVVEVRGTGATWLGGPEGFVVRAAGTVIRALVIDGFDMGVWFKADNSVVRDSYIGTDATGTQASPNFRGVYIDASAGDSVVGNLVSGNLTTGVFVGPDSTGNVVTGNLVGTDWSGFRALPNGTWTFPLDSGEGEPPPPLGGIYLQWASENLIGGGRGTPTNFRGAWSNLVSGNDGAGITIVGGSSNIVRANYVGTDAVAAQRLPNSHNGIVVERSGAGPTTKNFVDDNLVSGNDLYGIAVLDNSTFDTIVSNNLVGTNDTGTRPIGNERAGIGVAEAARTIVHGNTVAGNGWEGIVVGAATGTSITENHVGTNRAGDAAIANGRQGVHLLNGTTATAVQDNVISGNAGAGVEIEDTSSGNSLRHNVIGLDAAAANAMPNQTGVLLDGQTSGNVLEDDVVAGNVGDGVEIAGTATKNTVDASFVGTNRSGAAGLGNDRGVVVHDRASGNTLGPGNVVSGNLGDGVELLDESSGTYVGSNLVGTAPGGSAALGNGLDGVRILDATGNTVVDNTVSANLADGVTLAGNSLSNTVRGNWIGTTANGTGPLGNAANGVAIVGTASGNTVGGTVGGWPNVISANGADGVLVSGTQVGSNNVNGNWIGTDGSTKVDLGNGAAGVAVAGVLKQTRLLYNHIVASKGSGVDIAADNVVLSSNTILRNLGDGVTVRSGAHNLIHADSISANGGLGIDVNADGVTLSNCCGPNFPVLSQAVSSKSGTTISGTLAGAPSSTFTLEFFANGSCDPSGYGEGERLLGSAGVTTSSTGSASFTATVAGSTSLGESVTATATDAGQTTSELSNCAAVVGADVAVSVAAPGSVSVSQPFNYTITVRNNGPVSATNVVMTDTLPSIVSLASMPAGCSAIGSLVACGIPALPPNGVVTFTLGAYGNATGYATDQATVAADQLDPAPQNNTAQAQTIVNLPLIRIRWP